MRRTDKKFLSYKDVYDISDTTSCSKGSNKYHDKRCLDRKCENCGIQNLKNVLQITEPQQVCQWRRWEIVPETKRKEIVSKEGSFASFIEELTNECTTFSKHLFVAQWQHNQFRHLTENIPSGSVVQVLDFAQNYRCIFQNEVQSAHYGYNQVAIYKVHTTDTTKLPFIPLFVFICVMILTVVKRRNQ